MRSIKSIAAVGLMALTLGVAFAEQAEASASPHHRRGILAVAAHVAAGIIGGALLGAACGPPPSYAHAGFYGAPAYAAQATLPLATITHPPPRLLCTARPAAPVLIGVQQTRNCEIRTYQDAYGRQFSRKVCPQRYYY